MQIETKLSYLFRWLGSIFLAFIVVAVVGAALSGSESTPEPDYDNVVAAEESTQAHVLATPFPDESDASPEPALPFFDVVSITDGDTIKIRLNEKTETVRLVNMNTPETVDPRRPVECMGKEASEKMTELVSRKKVRLEIDETQTERDRYGRLLRFVFLEDGTDVGLELIKQGFAESSPYGSSPHKYLDEYKSAQSQAQTEQIGLWDPDICPTPTPEPTLQPIPKPTLQPTQKPTPQPPADGEAYVCNCKKTCPQMSSCEEAQYQLQVCGCSARDGDNDGIACDADCQ
jgi:micrococcal nuclease